MAQPDPGLGEATMPLLLKGIGVSNAEPSRPADEVMISREYVHHLKNEYDKSNCVKTNTRLRQQILFRQGPYEGPTFGKAVVLCEFKGQSDVSKYDPDKPKRHGPK